MTELMLELVPIAIRVFLIMTVPVVLVLVLASSVVAVMQSAMAVHEPVLLYAVRLGVFLLVGYFLFPTWVRAINNLALVALR